MTQLAKRDSESVIDAEQLSTWLSAIASPQRMRILSHIVNQPLHVSELARRVHMSRPLLYMHLAKLEEAGFVTGHHELTDDGKALKLFQAVPFARAVDLTTLVAAVNASTTSSETTLQGTTTGTPATTGATTESE